MRERERVKPKNKRASVPPSAGHMVPFGPPPVLVGENAAAYNNNLERASSAFKPRNYLEENAATNYADRQWLINSARHGKASILNKAARDGLKLLLQPLLDYDPVPDEQDKKDIAEWEYILEETDPIDPTSKYGAIRQHIEQLRRNLAVKHRAARDAQLQGLVDAWAKRQSDAVTRVEEILAAAGLTMTDVMAVTMTEHWKVIGDFNRGIATLEAEAAAILREFYWIRRTLGPELEG